jgi:hypothetical protein
MRPKQIDRCFADEAGRSMPNMIAYDVCLTSTEPSQVENLLHQIGHIS